MAEAWSSTAGAGLGPAHGQDRGWGRVPMSDVHACVRAHVRVASGGSSRTTQEESCIQ